MGRRGCAYDNAACESVMSTIKVELEAINNGRPHSGRRAARLAVFDYIEAFYNRVRLHSALGNLSPAEFEAAQLPAHPPVDMPGCARPHAHRLRDHDIYRGLTPLTDTSEVSAETG